MDVGDRLGPYLLKDVVSARATAVTYRVKHVELGRAALLKTLKPTVSPSSTFALNLEREAKILASLDHPNIISVYDFHHQEDEIWLVLEEVVGPRLCDLLDKSQTVQPDAATAIALEIARGLGHAHQRGVVHRDLRPEHVLLTKAGGVKIIEFATAFDGRMPSLPELIEGGQSLTNPYMAPEQMLGEPASPAMDVFSLGVLLSQMLCGIRRLDNAGGTTDLHRIQKQLPPLLQGLPDDIRRGSGRIALRCLADHPQQRYAQANEVAAELEAALRERTHLPTRGVLSAALVASKFEAEDQGFVKSMASLDSQKPHHLRLQRELRRLAPVLALIVAGGLVIELLVRDRDVVQGPSATQELQARSASRGQIKVLARPWAEVAVDGEVIDVTPIGRPIAVLPGRHYVTFRHPNAPDEKRTVVIAAGQTVILEVTMQIDRGRVDAGASRSVAEESP